MDASFLEKPRKVLTDWHLRQVVQWLNYDNNRELDNVLVYASLEMRSAIERDIFENLVLMKGGTLTPKEEKKCRSAQGIFALMKEVDPNFRKTFLFTKACLSAMSFPGTITIMNIGFLTDKWHELSNYCHKVLKPSESFESPNREFQKKGFKTIRDVLNYYYDLQGTQVGYITPNSSKDDLRSVYD